MKTIIIAVVALVIGSGITYYFVKPKAAIKEDTVLTAKFQTKDWNQLNKMMAYRLQLIKTAKDTAVINRQIDTLNGTIFPIIFHNIDSVYNK